jgi:phosphoenolpyruvate phosphomutase
MRTVVEYEATGVAAISLEDNIFPKRCSFYSGVQRELVSVEERPKALLNIKAKSILEWSCVAIRKTSLPSPTGLSVAADHGR